MERMIPHIGIIKDYESTMTPGADCWFFFIDENPQQSWGHSCKYAFIEVNNGKVHIEKQHIYPLSIDYENKAYYKRYK